MRKYLLAAVAAAAIASPAYAQMGAVTGPYVGIEAGVLFPKDTNIDADVNFANDAIDDLIFDNIIEVDYKRGRDIDVLAGYDLGGFRLEAELAFKRAKLNRLEIADEFQGDIGNDVTADDFDLAGSAKVRSIMGNALADFDAGGFRVYGGGGVGRARVKLLGDRDTAWAFQGIAGVGFPISPNVELGAKYRYFRTGKLDFQENFALTDADVLFRNESRFSSHSLLASLIFNLGAPAVVEAPYVAPVAAPPPQPMAPATQTCPDGSVVMATDICPAPPPPPPPPLPQPERG